MREEVEALVAQKWENPPWRYWAAVLKWSLFPREGWPPYWWHRRPRELRIPPWYRTPSSPPGHVRITVVTPSYNQARFLEHTLRSVLAQAYPNLEYIVQDGASTDGTTEILSRYQKHLAHVASHPDRGQAHALNLGFARSSGDIMAYLNADDILLPGTLHYVAAFFQQHPEIDVVYGHRVVMDEQGREIGRWVLPPHDTQVLYWTDYIPQETLFWRRQIWERVGGFDETLQFALDWDLILRFAQVGARVVRLPRFLGAFRVHTSQKTSSQWETLGRQEVVQLQRRYLGREVTSREVEKVIRPYLRRAFWYYVGYRIGLLRY